MTSVLQQDHFIYEGAPAENSESLRNLDLGGMCGGENEVEEKWFNKDEST